MRSAAYTRSTEHHRSYDGSGRSPSLGPNLGGRVASLDAAKEHFRVAWLRCRSLGVRP
jgi:hypothetical protein